MTGHKGRSAKQTLTTTSVGDDLISPIKTNNSSTTNEIIPFKTTTKLSEGTTSTPIEEELPEETTSKEYYQLSFAALIERALSGKTNIDPSIIRIIIFLGWVVTCVWLYIQDNALGKFDDPEGLQNILTKVGYISIFFVIVLVLTLFIKAKNKTVPKPLK